MYVSIIIPVYKDEARLNKCLQALNMQSFPKENFEVIVINNDPDEDVCISISHSLDLKLGREIRKGSYAARNKGINMAKGDLIAFTDSDAIPDPDWLRQGVQSMITEKGMKTLLAGKVKLVFDKPGKESTAECYEKYFAFPHQRIPGEILSVMVAGNVFIFSDTFVKIGMFNGELTSGGDTEFSHRVVHHGFRIKYNVDCIVSHPAKAGMCDLLKKRRRIFGGKVFRKIKVEKKNKLLSVCSVFINQIKRYFRELIIVITKLKVDKWQERIKLTVSILLIMVSLFYESFAIICANQMRRR